MAISNSNPLNNPELTLNLIHMIFYEDGTPKPELAKCVTHFKDRFREVCKKFAEKTGGSVSKPASSSETTKDGSRIKLSATLKGCTQDVAPGPARMSLEERVLTPTMEKVKFLFDTDAKALGSSWGSWMSNQRQPKVVIVAEPLNAKGEILIQAALLFHHPSDDVYAACARKSQVDTPLPEDQFFDVRGGTLFMDGVVAYLVNTDVIQYTNQGTGLGHPCLKVSFDDKYDPKGWQLMEAAQSSSTTLDNLKALAMRLGFKKVKEEESFNWGQILVDTSALEATCAKEAEQLRLKVLSRMGEAYPGKADNEHEVFMNVKGAAGDPVVYMTLRLMTRWTPFEPMNRRFFFETQTYLEDGADALNRPRGASGFPRSNHVNVPGNLNLLLKKDRAIYRKVVEESMISEMAKAVNDARENARYIRGY